jgi:Ser/Thr protein kinase RdoA (MazF antagonist)
LLHGDFHLNNLLFASTPGGRTVAVIDWQSCCRGRATRDLAHFLVGLPPDRRKAHERDLLGLYHRTLTEHGVAGYSFEQCLHDYRFTMLDELCFLVVVLAYFDFSASEAARRIPEIAIERFGAAILDHKAGEFLRE